MPPSGCSLLLRRFRTKTSLALRPPRRGLADFQIQLDDPHRVYSPTDLISGSVCVTVERALAVTHLTVSLIGCVDVNMSAREVAGQKRGKPRFSVSSVMGRGGGGGGSGFIISRDERVLCGDGRLDPGVFKFEFELEFCKLPGIGGLPTSLDFEKGSISYTIIATLTRPHIPNPTTTCAVKIALMDTVDISRYPIPKPIMFNLLSRHQRASKKQQAYQSSIDPSSSTATSSPSSSLANLHDSHSPPKEKEKERKPVTATVELLNAGALRGENIGVKISIQHTKRVKSLNGIILTLMRQTRLDPAGDIDDFCFEKGLLPPVSTFRMDLAQTICPLIVDPTTLTTVVRTSLRVPEDVFPTITNVPGGAVEFRYWVEVVMDLGGKLNGRDNIFTAVVPGFQRPAGGVEADFSKAGGGSEGGGGGSALSFEGGVMIETEKVRQEKGVVWCKFEVIVGTVDSVGKKGRMTKVVRERYAPPPPLPPPPPSQPQPQPADATMYDRLWQPPELDEKARLRRAEETLLPLVPVIGQVLQEEDENEDEREDKAERERRRLMARESSPPGIGVGEGSRDAPSAPELGEEGLPIYSR